MFDRLFAFLTPQQAQNTPPEAPEEIPASSFERCPEFKDMAMKFKKLCEKRDELNAFARESEESSLVYRKFLHVNGIVNDITREINAFDKEFNSFSEEDKAGCKTALAASIMQRVVYELESNLLLLNTHRDYKKQIAVGAARAAPVAAAIAITATGGLAAGLFSFFGGTLTKNIIMRHARINPTDTQTVILMRNLLDATHNAFDTLRHSYKSPFLV